VKQVLQYLRTGETLVSDVPAPHCKPGHLRVANSVSLVSAGTERMLVDFARGSVLSKAMQQPERVRDVLNKIRTDGLLTTYEAVSTKLDLPMALGYCSVGRVLEVGAGVEGFAKGDRVASNGAHAEIVVVPWTLASIVPENVSDESAAFTALGAVAVQGVRLASPAIGECFAVTGLGLVGLLAVQILRANGCRVLGIDIDPSRLQLARNFGADTVDLSRDEDPLSRSLAFSRGRGVDGVLLTLSSKSSKSVSNAAKMCRKRGRIVLVGTTGLELNRADFYEKEITFQVSCSYGPGRHDPQYEDAGRDYPLGYVRWTEQRNFEAVLDMLSQRQLDTTSLTTHRYQIEEAQAAYDVLASREPSLRILLRYPERLTVDDAALQLKRISPTESSQRAIGSGTAGFIGAGNYGGRILIAAFKQAGANLHTIVSAKGVSAVHHGGRLGFRFASSDAEQIFAEPEIDIVCIATRHDSHAEYVQKALRAGKSIFVEKPLALNLDQLKSIESAFLASRQGQTQPLLMVGFNRRFAPLSVKIKSLLAAVREPKSFIMTINAGSVPKDHWVQNPEIGGGRLIVEACHFIDFLRHLAGSPIRDFHVTPLYGPAGPAQSASISLQFEDGSFGVINYLANGNREYPKERLEIYTEGKILVLDNFRSLTGFGWPKFSKMRTWRQNKGQAECVLAFVTAVKTAMPSPIPLPELLEVSRIAILAAQRTT